MRHLPTKPTPEEIKELRDTHNISLHSSKLYLENEYKHRLKKYILEELDCAPSLVTVRKLMKLMLEELV